jgi:MFS family permease
MWVLSRRLLLTTSLIALGVGAILIGLTSYVPTYLEVGIGAPPLVGGLALAALTLGWPLSATFSGRLFYLKYGFRPTALIGMGLVLLGALLLAVRAHSPQVAVVAVACFVIGLGLGLVAAPSLIAAQASVGWAERGVVTGANMFARSIGSAVGVAVFGAVANAVLDASGGPTNPQAMIDAGSAVFLAVLVATVLTIFVSVLMPKLRADDAELAQPEMAPESA